MENLAFVQESELNDSIEIILLNNEDELSKFFKDTLITGMTITGWAGDLKVRRLFSIYGEKYSPLKHELMHVITRCKWGDDKSIYIEWLSEGLAVLANPETYSCDGYTLEERYLYYLQTNKLYQENALNVFPRHDVSLDWKIIYNQSGYIVQYLMKDYGVDRIKKLWQKGMRDFEKVFGVTFKRVIEIANNDLKREYPNLISFNEERMNKNVLIDDLGICINRD